MPLYEYECTKCGHRFEKIRKFSDPPVETCPECGGPVRKLMSSPAIQFKGSGWYVTDYAKKDTVASGTSKETKDSKPAAETTGKKSDTPAPATSTPSAKTDTKS